MAPPRGRAAKAANIGKVAGTFGTKRALPPGFDQDDDEEGVAYQVSDFFRDKLVQG
jgi:hypothetical protein